MGRYTFDHTKYWVKRFYRVGEVGKSGDQRETFG